MASRRKKNSDAWTAMYWGDLLRDTGHLGPTEFGIYMLLLSHYYSRGKPLPASAEQLQNISRCKTDAQSRALGDVLQDFFYLDGDVYRNTRADEELQKRKEISESRAEAARLRHAKAGASGDASAGTNAQQMHTQPQPHVSTTTGAREKFQMFEDWEPDREQLKAHLRTRGIQEKNVPPEALGEFRSYWMAREREHSQIEWTQKLSASIHKATTKQRGNDNGSGKQRRGTGSASAVFWANVFTETDAAGMGREPVREDGGEIPAQVVERLPDATGSDSR